MGVGSSAGGGLGVGVGSSTGGGVGAGVSGALVSGGTGVRVGVGVSGALVGSGSVGGSVVGVFVTGVGVSGALVGSGSVGGSVVGVSVGVTVVGAAVAGHGLQSWPSLQSPPAQPVKAQPLQPFVLHSVQALHHQILFVDLSRHSLPFFVLLALL